jgi:hypothetical protein
VATSSTATKSIMFCREAFRNGLGLGARCDETKMSSLARITQDSDTFWIFRREGHPYLDGLDWNGGLTVCCETSPCHSLLRLASRESRPPQTLGTSTTYRQRRVICGGFAPLPL